MMKNENGDTMPCETQAGGKHQHSPEFRRHIFDWMLHYTEQHNLIMEDNNRKADERKAERYREKDLALKNILLDTAAASLSLQDLRRRLLENHQIQLIVRGSTISVLPPERKKAIRLRSLNLDPAELLRTMGISAREFSPGTAQSELERQQADKDRKLDARWLRDCRTRNNQKAVAALEAADLFLTKQALQSRDYDPAELTALRNVNRQTIYAQRDLQTEFEKLNRIYAHWVDYKNTHDPQCKARHGLYLKQCGFHPDSKADLEELTTMQKRAMLQLEHLGLTRDALLEVLSGYSNQTEPPQMTDTTEFPDIPSDGQIQEPYPDDSLWMPPQHRPDGFWWTEEYKQARQLLYGTTEEPAQPEQAYQLMKKTALSGNGFALYDLGQMLRKGTGCEPDEERSETYFRAAHDAFLSKLPSEKNPAYLQYRIAKLYQSGLGVEQDYEAAAAWLQKSVVAGNPHAAYSLAKLYRKGLGVDADTEKAYMLYEQAATSIPNGNAYAAYELGNLCRNGIGTDVDPALADTWYALAYRGFQSLEKRTMDDTLLYRLGQMNHKGMGTPVNIDQAKVYYERAAAMKNSNALYGLGMICLDEELPEHSIEKAVSYLKSAADLGNTFAQYQLAKMYLSGEQVPRDLHRAVSLLSDAADHGSDMAQFRLGQMLYYGTGMRQNTPQAIRYLERSADHGNSFSMALLGQIYLRDESVQNKKQGMYYLRLGAELDNSAALYQLGKALYYTHNPQLRKEAIRDLRRAADQSNPAAMWLLGKILITEGTGSDIREGIDLLLKGRSETDPTASELLAAIKENRKKFGEIAYHYQKLANRHIYNENEKNEAARFRAMWHNQLEAERYLKQQMKQNDLRQNRFRTHGPER